MLKRTPNSEKGISQYLPSILVGITFVQIVFTHFSENDIQQGKRKPDGGEKEEVEHTMGKEKYP